jgi:hypothetical protein
MWPLGDAFHDFDDFGIPSRTITWWIGVPTGGGPRERGRWRDYLLATDLRQVWRRLAGLRGTADVQNRNEAVSEPKLNRPCLWPWKEAVCQVWV